MYTCIILFILTESYSQNHEAKLSLKSSRDIHFFKKIVTNMLVLAEFVTEIQVIIFGFNLA